MVYPSLLPFHYSAVEDGERKDKDKGDKQKEKDRRDKKDGKKLSKSKGNKDQNEGSKVVSSGSYFGEGALLKQEVPRYDVVAKTRCTVLTLTSENFHKFLKVWHVTSPSVMDTFIGILLPCSFSLHLASSHLLLTLNPFDLLLGLLHPPFSSYV